VSAPAIAIHGASKRFGAQQSLDGLELRVESGSVFGFLGPNGAGKTTTLRLMLGLVRADAGQVRVLGLDPREHADAIRARVGVLLEHDGTYNRLSARHNLDYYARIHHLPASERTARIEELLRAFGLWDRRDDAVLTWSKGMRQKLAIARALLHRPKLVLLDEPFSGLDPVAATELRTLIVDLARKDGVTVFLTTHDLAHVERACDRVAVLKAGKVIANGTPSALSGDDGDGDGELRVAVSGPGLAHELLAQMERDGLIVSFTLGDGQAELRCTRGQRGPLGVELVQRGVAIEELRTLSESLENAFLSLMKGAQAS
jgi:ABC-2 type transport system ATP-binding protein